jgi:MFS family permease
MKEQFHSPVLFPRRSSFFPHDLRARPLQNNVFVPCFRYPNYRLFFGGQIVSLIGSWIGSTATSWLVYRLTGSALLLGLVGFMNQFPAFFVTPFGGIIVDRWDRRRLLVATQTLSMFQSLALAYLALTQQATVPALLFLSAVQGLVNAFDMPGRQAFVVDLIENKDDLGNAIALNSSMFNLARLVGPTIGGLLIAAVGEGWCFLIDGLSYLAVISALLMMRTRPPAPSTPHPRGVLHSLWEGWRYAYHSRPIRSILALLALASLLGAPYMTIVPIFAGKVLKGGPHTMGFLMTAGGCGALLGALTLAVRPSSAGGGPLDSPRGGYFRGGSHRFFFFADFMGVDAVVGCGGVRVYDPNGRQQHPHSNHRRRRQARAGNEFVRNVLAGSGPHRQCGGRIAHRNNRGPQHTDAGRILLPGGRDLVLQKKLHRVGFEPTKGEARQIYSLVHLTALPPVRN